MSVEPLPVATDTGAPLALDLGQSETQLVSAKTLIQYGNSGLGKSTEFRKAARYFYELRGLPVRLVSAEDSSKQIFEDLINIGVVEAFFVTKARNPLATFRQFARGAWPREEKSGGVTWVPWEHQASAYIVEGLTSMAEQLLEYFRENGMFLREQANDAVVTGGERVSPASQTAFGVAQDEMIAALKGYAAIPGIERVIWSAHEVAASEDGSSIRGPALVGSKKTSLIQKHVGTLLHIDAIPENGKIVRRVYFVRHPDPAQPHITYPAKTTLPPEATRRLLSLYPGGYYDADLESGLGEFLRSEAECLASSQSSGLAWKREVDARRAGRVRGEEQHASALDTQDSRCV